MRIFFFILVFTALAFFNVATNSVVGGCGDQAESVIFLKNKMLEVKKLEKKDYQCSPTFELVALFTNSQKNSVTYYATNKVYFPIGAIAILANFETPNRGEEYRYKSVPAGFETENVFNQLDFVFGTDSIKVVINPVFLAINLLILFLAAYFFINLRLPFLPTKKK